ncbi:MAG: NosD domain-containing protein [Promethearchaeota archaeon]
MKANPKRVVFCFLLMLLLTFPLYFSISLIIYHRSEEYAGENGLHISAIYNSPIPINDLPGSLTNWTWARDQGYCTGSGTSSNPYIIRNHIFNASLAGTSPLSIRNSLKHFIIEDCFFIADSIFAGIYFLNVTNGIVRGNSMGANVGALISMRNSSYNLISNNIASDGAVYGIELNGYNGAVQYNTISNNIVSRNLNTGIRLQNGCNNNIISENIISDNGIYGISLDNFSVNNEIFLNCLNNTDNAIDNGTNNQWDTGNRGNYWDDYPDDDGNGDGIGDTPYDITGSAGSQDNYPLMKCPERSAGGEIPGYKIGILVSSLFVLTIGIIYLTLKKKINSHSLY